MTTSGPCRHEQHAFRCVGVNALGIDPLGVCVALAMVLSTAGLCWAEDGDETDTIVIKAKRIHTGVGESIDQGIVVIQGGRITAVGRDLRLPEDARVIEEPNGVVTPGLIDACCAVDFEVPQEATDWVRSPRQYSFWEALGHTRHDGHGSTGWEPVPQDRERPQDGAATHTCGHYQLPLRPAEATEALSAAQSPRLTWAEHSSEVTPHRLVADSLNLLSNDFARLVKGGVTTVYVSPDSANVIGSRGAIVKTAGPLGERIVRQADAVKATLGGDPSRRGRSNYLPPLYGPTPSFHTRRPTTRMGVEWVFRKAFYDAERARAGSEIHGADMPPAAAVPVLQQILDGAVPLRFQARKQHDIFTALRLAAEFKLSFILEEATEAYRCLPQLQAADVPVIFGPLYMTPSGYRRRTDEVDRPRLNAPRQLADAGIQFALTAQELRDEEGLVRQGMLAMRNGLSAEETLRALTATPAAMLGLEGQLGVLAPGAAADLVIWNTEPFDATSRPLVVMVGGRVVYEE